MLTPLTILSLSQGAIYERAAPGFRRPHRLVAWVVALRARLDRARRRLWLTARLRRLDATWREALLTYRAVAEA